MKFLQDLRARFSALPEIKTYYDQGWSIKGPFTSPARSNIKF